MFLLDTNVIPALSPSGREAARDLVVWLDRASRHLFVSAITAAEVASGIAKAEREGASATARPRREWWQAIEHLYREKRLPFDLECAPAAGAIPDDARAHRAGFEDIAATARVHGLTVPARSPRNFEPLGVPVLDPFQVCPSPP